MKKQVRVKIFVGSVPQKNFSAHQGCWFLAAEKYNLSFSLKGENVVVHQWVVYNNNTNIFSISDFVSEIEKKELLALARRADARRRAKAAAIKKAAKVAKAAKERAEKALLRAATILIKAARESGFSISFESVFGWLEGNFSANGLLMSVSRRTANRLRGALGAVKGTKKKLSSALAVYTAKIEEALG